MDKKQLQEYVEFGFHVLDQTGELILQEVQRGFTIETKWDKTVVTAIDRAAEKLAQKEIIQKYPSHGILGEEYGAINPTADFRWLIDPIDGTEAFVRGSTEYGTLFALQHAQKTIVGIIDHPSHNLRYHAFVGGGTYRDGLALTIQDADDPASVPVAICRRGQFERHGAVAEYETLWRKIPKIKEISDCWGHTRVLEGEVGAMVDYSLNPWDIEATRILVEEAGGLFLITDEKKKSDGTPVYGIVFGKPSVVRWISSLL